MVVDGEDRIIRVSWFPLTIWQPHNHQDVIGNYNILIKFPRAFATTITFRCELKREPDELFALVFTWKQPSVQMPGIYAALRTTTAVLNLSGGPRARP